MKHLLTIISCFAVLTTNAQSAAVYNPDSDSDLFIGVADVVDLLSLYGNGFNPNSSENDSILILVPASQYNPEIEGCAANDIWCEIEVFDGNSSENTLNTSFCHGGITILLMNEIDGFYQIPYGWENILLWGSSGDIPLLLRQYPGYNHDEMTYNPEEYTWETGSASSDDCWVSGVSITGEKAPTPFGFPFQSTTIFSLMTPQVEVFCFRQPAPWQEPFYKILDWSSNTERDPRGIEFCQFASSQWLFKPLFSGIGWHWD